MRFHARKLGFSVLLLAIAFSVAAGFSQQRKDGQGTAQTPWNSAQAADPSQLAQILSAKQHSRPVILQVGFATLYRSKHIPGSIYAGPASNPAGLEKLKAAVRDLKKNTDIYIYCGCCPIGECPNIRPAFRTLKALGFTRLHVLVLPENFGKDWVAKGYPVASGTTVQE